MGKPKREDVMRRHNLTAAALAAGVAAFAAGQVCAEEFSARLNGFEELGALNGQTGAVLSNGTGTLKLDLDEKKGTATWTLTYSNVGTTPPKTGTVSQAHIHFGKSRDSGGVMVFFCTNLGNGPAGTPGCPDHSGTVTGTWAAASVVGPAAQNIAAGNFDGLVDAIISNTAYANIHTTSKTTPDTAFPAGEIRGQVRGEDREHRDD